MAITRRDLLRAGSVLAAYGLPSGALLQARAAAAQTAEPKQPFDYAWLKGEARHLAEQAYADIAPALPKVLDQISWDDYQKLRFKRDKALWAKDTDSPFRVEMFHLGLYFKQPVHIYEVSAGTARAIEYDQTQFDTRGTRVKRVPHDLGYAGFRVQHHSDWQRDIVAFLGASYFRAVGGQKQYGLSARGLAVDTGLARAEEFPRFKAFWLEQPKSDPDELVVYALLDSPSVTGAYRFGIRPGETLLMEVDAALYPRKPIERLGIAPLTSMYQTGENDRRLAYDFRPEIHDSDGLALHTGSGEWIWRPLVNPRTLRVNSYIDQSPRGFGLMQRDRDFANYQDDGVWYDRRPSLWVEPKGDWGKGSVQLVEIPTNDETFDNIVAYWNPEQPVARGEELLFAYRLYWGAVTPARPPLATVQATRTGLGGVIGRKREYFSWRFAVDFAGGALAELAANSGVEPVITATRGSIEIPSARPLEPIRGYRALFDIRPDESLEPIDLRLYLKQGKNTLTETWVYQWTPPPLDQRTLY